MPLHGQHVCSFLHLSTVTPQAEPSVRYSLSLPAACAVPRWRTPDPNLAAASAAPFHSTLTCTLSLSHAHDCSSWATAGLCAWSRRDTRLVHEQGCNKLQQRWRESLLHQQGFGGAPEKSTYKQGARRGGGRGVCQRGGEGEARGEVAQGGDKGRRAQGGGQAGRQGEGFV